MKLVSYIETTTFIPTIVMKLVSYIKTTTFIDDGD